jgi:hypothetical protein
MSAHPPAGLDPQGTDTIAVGEHQDCVMLRFEKPVLWVILDSETARNVAEKIARTAYKVRFGDDPTTQAKSVITDAVVARLRLRVRKMLQVEFAGAEETKFSIAANAIVDAVLQEAT